MNNKLKDIQKSMVAAEKLIERQKELNQVQEQVINLFMEGETQRAVTLYKSYLETKEKEVN